MGRSDAPILALPTLDCLLSSLPEYDARMSTARHAALRSGVLWRTVADTTLSRLQLAVALRAGSDLIWRQVALL